VLAIFTSAEKSMKTNKEAGALPNAPEGEQEMNPEQVKKMLDEALAPVMKSITDLKTEFTAQLGEVKKANEPVKLEETEFGKSLLQKADEQQKVLDELMKRIVPSNVLENVDPPTGKAEPVKKAELSEQIKGTPLSARA